MLNFLTTFYANILLGQIPMADAFRSDGKIYVVLAIMLILLIGLFYYLFRLDRKIKDLENRK